MNHSSARFQRKGFWRLSLNLTMTNVMAFKPYQRKHSSIFIKPSAQVNNTVFLRVVLRNNLTWKSNESSFANITSKIIMRIIFRLPFYLKNLFFVFFETMILPYPNNYNLVGYCIHDLNSFTMLLLGEINNLPPAYL